MPSSILRGGPPSLCPSLALSSSVGPASSTHSHPGAGNVTSPSGPSASSCVRMFLEITVGTGNTGMGSTARGVELQPALPPGLPVTSSGPVAIPAAPAERAVAGEEDESQGEKQDLPGRDRVGVCHHAVLGEASGAGGHGGDMVRVPYQDAGASLGSLVGRLHDEHLQLLQQGPVG